MKGKTVSRKAVYNALSPLENAVSRTSGLILLLEHALMNSTMPNDLPDDVSDILLLTENARQDLDKVFRTAWDEILAPMKVE